MDSYSNPYASENDPDDTWQTSQRHDPMRHSGLGIASFVLSIFSGLMIFVAIVVAGYIEATTPGGLDEESNEAVVMGLAILAFCGLELLAGLLGLISVFDSTRKRIFGILGLIFSCLIVTMTACLIILGLMIEA